MKLFSFIAVALVAILFQVPQGFGQSVTEDPLVQPLSEQEFSELQQAIKSGDQETVNAISKRHADRERRHKHGRNNDNPQPDQDPGDGESVVTPDDSDAEEIEPVEGREERDARKKRHHEEQERHRIEIEKQRREQEEYDRAHPKPVQPTGFFGIIWSWVVWPIIGTVFAPFAWFFTLSKWVMVLVLLVVAIVMVTAVGFFGSVALSVCSWLWVRINRIWTKSNS